MVELLEHTYPILVSTGVSSVGFLFQLKMKNLHRWARCEKGWPCSIKGRRRIMIGEEKEITREY